ncbi:MAG: translation initiation factor IF-2 [Candidatus Kerfeldbacteria bacterium]|nr:translation initiation factor IF-2 [Candidatus Kerfeldbacteria bacterium]
MPVATQPKKIALPPRIVIREFASRLGLPVTQVMAELIKNGIMSSQNEEIDFETAAIIAGDFGFQTGPGAEAAEGSAPTYIIDEWISHEDPKTLTPRPPVVVVMGHVDHGKTKLLDTIRRTKVVESEAGGITQHIGAYQAEHKGRTVTFIDTPGHEAFSAMRSRGAKVADVAILVVAADDGVKPQTKEAIEILNSAGISFAVAINKIDLPAANPEKVKKELAELNVQAEEWGGKIPMVGISAKAGTNIDELLDTALLVADVEKEKVIANPSGRLLGTIIESNVDPGEGAVATVLVHNGTLKVGDQVKAGAAFGKVKALKDSAGKTVKEAPPSFPARVLGLKGVAKVGDNLTVADDVKALKKQAKKAKVSRPLETTLPEPITPESEGAGAAPAATKLNVVLKADRLGSLEALRDAIDKLSSDEVQIVIVHQGLGNITEADVLRADAATTHLLGFQSAVTPKAEAVAKGRDLEVKTFSVIYDLVDFVREQAEALLAPEVVETTLGHLKVLAIFRTEHSGMVVGGRVESGKVEPDSQVRVKRGDAVVSEGSIKQLQHNKQAVKEVVAGQEAGIRYEGPPVIKEGDVLEIFRVEKRKRHIGP